ncbi:MAG: potassium channel protein [Nitriliruptor sp.]|nr:MAG: potassium channel protein [Nitriliruptor sp.]
MGAIEAIRAVVPVPERAPLVALGRRIALAVGLLFVVAIAVLATRGGYVDETGRPIGLIDALYYASVSVTTTGYGDITPVTTGARLTALLVITPARVAFLLVVVGTTVELLTERWRETLRLQRWRRRVRGHHVICGYGVKGRSAAQTLAEGGKRGLEIVVVELDPEVAEQATQDGLAVIIGDAARTRTLLEAEIERAAAVIVAPERDDAAVLITLTARELAPDATIVAAVREQENAHLLRQSGADAVITSAETSGRLLGVTSRNPRVAAVVTDLLQTSQGLVIDEREVAPDEVGRPLSEARGINLAVVRRGTMLRYDNPAVRELVAGDLLLGLPEPKA